MDPGQQLLLVLASIFVLGIGAQWLAWRFRVPAILLLLAVGFTAGSVTGFIRPDDVFGDLLLPVTSLSVGLILFEGGLNLRFRELRGTWRSLLGMLSVGVLLTWFGATLAAVWLLQLPATIALVLGAVLTVTGPTVIGPMLREIRPSGRVGAIAKWEGIMIDPIGATLAVLVFEAIEAIRQREFGSATMSALGGLAAVATIGVVIGVAAAVLLAIMLRRYWIPDYLQNAMSLLFVVGAFTSANLLYHEAGLLAVTVMGITLANQRQVDLHHMMEFKESLTVLLIATLFILLSARVPFESLASFGWWGPVYALVLIVIVRPVSIWISTVGSGLSMAERGFLCWLAPRGIVAAAVSTVFALRLGETGAAIAPATFIVIFMTVGVYGSSAGWLARKLKLSTPDAQGLLIAGANSVAVEIARPLKKEGFPVVLVDTSYWHIQKARDAGLTACFANILSGHVLDEVDFGGLGRFLALTSNDEVNALAAARFRELFGRDKVYQLPRSEAKSSRFQAEWQRRLVGRPLFAAALTYDFINGVLSEGGSVKVTRLTKEFDYEAHKAHYGSNAWPLFVIDGTKLVVITSESKLAPKPGQSLVCLVRKDAAAAAAAANASEAEKAAKPSLEGQTA